MRANVGVFGAISVSLFRPARFEVFDDVSDRETHCLGVGEEPIAQPMEKLLAIRCRVLRGVAFGSPTNEGADTALRGEDAAPLELRVDLGDGVRVDREIDGEPPHGREAVTDLQPTRRDVGADGALELGVNGCWVTTVDEHGVEI
jgi:hypothetical protein